MAKIINENEDFCYNIILKFLPNVGTFSIEVPSYWSVKKLNKLIISTFEHDFKNTESIFIYKTKPLKKYFCLTLKELFNQNKTNLIIINFKEDSSNLKEQLTKIHSNEILTKNEFIDIENKLFNSYEKLYPKNQISYKTFPIMASGLKRRIAIVNNKNKKFDYNDFGSFEKFPFKNYFQVEIIFKLFVSYIVFNIYMKGWKFPFFISLLLVYYWYEVKNSIDEYYKSQIEKIELNENEKKEFEIEKLNINNKDSHESIKSNEVINKNENNKNKISENIDINQQNDFKNYINCFNEIIYTLIMSLFPLWCDNFEKENPLPEENKYNQQQENNENTNNPNQNNENINNENNTI